MGVIGGKNGAVGSQPCVGKWSINMKSENPAYASSSTAGGMARLAGNTDWSGTFSGYGATPAVFTTEEFTFVGSIDGTNGATGPAIVDSLSIVCDIEGSKPITYDVGFSSKGELTLGAAAATDTTTTLAETSKGCSADIDGVAVTDVRKWTLSITATNPTYNSSSTAGATGRVAGNIDATIAIDVYCDDFADLPTPGTEVSVALWVGSTSVTGGSWALTFARVGDLSNLAVDVETGAAVSATINLALSAIGANNTLGAITAPGGATVWPAA